MNILDEIIKEGDLVFDVGCNMGGKSEKYLEMGASVIGVEPQPKCITKLKEKFDGNNNFKLEPVGLDIEKGIGFIYENIAHTISSMSLDFIHTTKDGRFKDYKWGTQIQIEVNTLDNLIRKHGTPKFIKIDVEGYEYEVLSGLTQPVNTLSIEFTPELCSKTVKCIEYVDRLNGGNSVFNYGSNEKEVFAFDEWVNKYDIIKFLESIDDYVVEFGDVYIKRV